MRTTLSRLLVFGCLAVASALGAEERSFTRSEDVIYGRAFGTALTLDVFQPGQANGLGVIYVVSGGWFSSHDFINAKVAQPLLNRGYTVFAVVHGSNPRFHIPEIIEQLERSVRFIRFNAVKYSIDPERIGVAGGSAGGHLSLMLATRGGPGKADAKDPVDRQSSAVQAAACFFPPTDFLNYSQPGESALGEGILKDFRSAFGNVPTEPEAKRQFGESISPIYHLKNGAPPVFIIHGDADKLVPIQQAKIFLDGLSAVGGVGKLDTRPGAQHGWGNWEADVALFADWFDKHLKRGQDASQASALRFEDLLKIDAHVHFFDEVPEFVELLRRTQTRVANICVGGNQPELLVPSEKRAEELRQKYSPQFQFASTFDLTRRNEPDYVRGVTNWLEETFRGGAVMVKIWKAVGMEVKTPAGAFMMPDDSVLDPIYGYLTNQRRPLMAHFADPIDAWRPLDPASAHHAYYASHPDWHVYGRKDFPTHAEILDARDRMLARHPDLVVIAAHLGSEAHDLDSLAKRFDRLPNLYADVAARTPELQRQPAAKVREFFIRYQDRLLYGTDAEQYTPGRLPSAEERAAFVSRMESWYRRDFEYYSGKGSRKLNGREVGCLELPRPVLDKFYHGNARRLIPGIAADSPTTPRASAK
jgi:acetyl esterase/lipase/predicted TIM-barrel fold metal-dependent hydrolase